MQRLENQSIDVIGELTILDFIHSYRFHLSSHWFWPEFIQGWEPQTFDFYKRYSVQGLKVIDIGSWVGPTAVLALINGAS